MCATVFMEAPTFAALCTIGQSEIRLDPLTLIKDFHVILSGREHNWTRAERAGSFGGSGLSRRRGKELGLEEETETTTWKREKQW